MKKLLIVLATLATATLVLPACSSTCTDGETQCSDMQIQTCTDGTWGDAIDCDDAMENCMTMDDGEQHCMGEM